MKLFKLIIPLIFFLSKSVYSFRIPIEDKNPIQYYDTSGHIEIEYIDLIGFRKKIEKIDLNDSAIINILSGKRPVILKVLNAPVSFKYIGNIKKDEANSTSDYALFDFTEEYFKGLNHRKVQRKLKIGKSKIKIRKMFSEW